MYSRDFFFDMLNQIGQIRDVKTIRHIAMQCASDRILFDDILNLLLLGIDRERKMASWIISTAVEYNSQLISDEQHLRLTTLLDSEKSGTIIRNVVRTWQYALSTKEEVYLPIIEYCFQQLMNTQQEIAIRAFAVTVLERYIEQVPELREEVMFFLERELPFSSPAFAARARRYLKRANKMERLKNK